MTKRLLDVNKTYEHRKLWRIRPSILRHD